MAISVEGSGNSGGGKAGGKVFLVEIREGEQVRYAICEQAALVEARDVPGLPAEAIDKAFETSGLRAIPIPYSAGPGGGEWSSQARGFLSGVNINITINND